MINSLAWLNSPGSRGEGAWLLDPPKAKPERKDFGLPEHTSELSTTDRNRIEEALTSIIRSWKIEDILVGSEQDTLRERMLDFWCSHLACTRPDLDDRMKTLAGNQAGVPEQILETLSAERRYRAALQHWNSYLKWKTERNPARAQLEAQFGFDAKHASHLLRLSRMCVEILRDRVVRVHRPDAQELLEVRQGVRSFESIEAEFKALELEVETISQTTTLPKAPDHDLIDRTLVRVLESS